MDVGFWVFLVLTIIGLIYSHLSLKKQTNRNREDIQTINIINQTTSRGIYQFKDCTFNGTKLSDFQIKEEYRKEQISDE